MRRTKGQIEAEVCEAVIKFEKEYNAVIRFTGTGHGFFLKGESTMGSPAGFKFLCLPPKPGIAPVPTGPGMNG